MEIERTYLLDRLPDLPPGTPALRIEQGYLQESRAGGLEGRLRRTVHPDGRVTFTHTVKRGSGLVRSETERSMPPEEFERFWPLTADQRLSKTRFLLNDNVSGFVWEIDEFDKLELVLAEVELPNAHTKVTPPPWLTPHIVRDVTEEKRYRNYELALELARQRRERSGGGR